MGAVLGLVLFPLWPFELKYLLWKVSLWLLVGFCAIIAARLVVYLLLGVFGVSFWLFPRFFENNVNTIDSFLPVYSVQRWEGSNVQAIVTRLLLLSLFVYYGYHIYSDPGMLRGTLLATQKTCRLRRPSLTTWTAGAFPKSKARRIFRKAH